MPEDGVVMEPSTHARPYQACVVLRARQASEYDAGSTHLKCGGAKEAETTSVQSTRRHSKDHRRHAALVAPRGAGEGGRTATGREQIGAQTGWGTRHDRREGKRQDSRPCASRVAVLQGKGDWRSPSETCPRCCERLGEIDVSDGPYAVEYE